MSENECQDVEVYSGRGQVAVREQPGLVPTVHELQVYQTIAEQAEASKFYQGLGGRAGIVSIMLYARELNVPPMLAISGGIHNIQGKIEMSARLINSKIRESGHSIKIVQLDEKVCRLWGKRKDTAEELEVSYSIEQAKKAGLVRDGSNWTKNPEDMLFSRAISRMGRRLFPDVIGTAYVEGEVREVVDADPPGPRRKEKPMPEPKATKSTESKEPQVTSANEPKIFDVPPDAPEQPKNFPGSESPTETAEQPAEPQQTEVDLNTIPCWRMVLAFLTGTKHDEAQIALAIRKICEHFNVEDPTDLAKKTGAELLSICKSKEFLASLKD